MAQRVTWSLSPLELTAVDRTLGRIGLADRNPFRWEALNWFTDFSQRDLGVATEGDWLSLTEEVQALLHLITFQHLRAPITRDDLQGLQKEVLKVFAALVDHNEASIGTFQVRAFIHRGTGRLAGSSQIKRLGPLTSFPAGPFAGFIGPDGLNGLMYHFVNLLMRFPDTVQRCPHCQRLFARFRRHAKYCTRKCQSVAAAREDRRKKANTKEKMITKKTKKGAKHGASRR